MSGCALVSVVPARSALVRSARRSPEVIFRRDRVAELGKEGRSWSKIAKEVGASVASVLRAFKKYNDTGCQKHRKEALDKSRSMMPILSAYG